MAKTADTKSRPPVVLYLKTIYGEVPLGQTPTNTNFKLFKKRIIK